MNSPLFTPIAELGILEFALDFLFVFAGPVVDAFALTTCHLEKPVLRHLPS